MQPNGFPIDLKAIAANWEQFMMLGVAAADPAVLQSWRRCVPRFDPRTPLRPTTLKEPSLTAVRRGQADFIALATPFLEDVHQFSEGADSAILLTDGTACTLAILGDATGVSRLAQLGVGLGTYWAEGQMGTTALGMALFEPTPILVVGAEHYFQTYHHLATAAAPIHDVRGRIVGLMGLVTQAEAVTPHILSLVMAAARAITNQLHTETYLKEATHRLREVNTLLGAIAEGVIAWNEMGEITHVNEPAAALLQLATPMVLGQPLSHALDLPPRLTYAIQNGYELHEAELAFTVNGQNVPCIVSLRPISDGKNSPTSYLATLRPVAHIRQMVQRQVTAPDTLTLTDLMAPSGEMKGVLRLATAAAKGKAPILLRGEAGVGKNQFARAIHNDSPRASQPFLVINCRAIPHELMLGEFLGHEGDTHTTSRLSKFELAEGGTILLDQIEHLSLEMQSALLQLIETSHVMRLGSTHPIHIDVRICAATSSNLEKRIREASFLSQLFYAFGVFAIEIPPLRERIIDAPVLAERFFARIAQPDAPPPVLGPDALEVFNRYPWPGNVRELESVLERAMLSSRDGVVRVTDLPETVRQGRALSGQSLQPVISVTESEREAIIRAGLACNGKMSEMAQRLGIGRTTLWRKMRQYRLVPEQFKV